MKTLCIIQGYTTGYSKLTLNNKLNITQNKSIFKVLKVSDILVT